MKFIRARFAILILLGLFTSGCAGDPSPPDAAAGQTMLSQATCESADLPTCVDAVAPDVTLVDKNPKSPTFEKSLSIQDFSGKPTIVALLSGW